MSQGLCVEIPLLGLQRLCPEVVSKSANDPPETKLKQIDSYACRNSDAPGQDAGQRWTPRNSGRIFGKRVGKR